MTTMQELLFQKKLDRELPERRAEAELQDAKNRLAEDIQDIQALETWHGSKIQARILEWQSFELKHKGSSPLEGEVLFCDLKMEEDQQVSAILERKESLVQTWYEDKQGLNNVRFRSNQRGTMRYMVFGFYSADMEAKMRAKCLTGRCNYEANLQSALKCVRKRLPGNAVEIVEKFIPGYVDHLKQEKELVEQTRPW